MREAYASGGRKRSFERLLAHLQRGDTKRCDKDVGGCGTPARVQHQLMHAPEVFTISLAWDTTQAAEDEVAATMKARLRVQLACSGAGADASRDVQALRPTLQPAKVYNSASSSISASDEYELRAMVCYYGNHYAAYARTDADADNRCAWLRWKRLAVF
jgi:hypothetical protein